MKEKVKMLGYIILILVLTHVMFVAGCGKNPLVSALFGNMTVQIVKL